jgi:hypothetical protein
MPNPASALGEAIGKSVEAEIQSIIRNIVEPFGLFVDVGGERIGKRRGRKLLLVNDTGNEYQIDTVVEDENGNPLILVESKYIRYKKHNRDKGSWTCVAHYKLRTTYPTIKKSIAILLGNWSKPSKLMMESFNIDLIEIPFTTMVEATRKHQIIFDWPEKDSETPAIGWQRYQQLSGHDKKEIARECLAGCREKLEDAILSAIKADPQSPKNVDQIELLIKTTHKEYFVKKFTRVTDAAKYLLSLTEDVVDLKGRL